MVVRLALMYDLETVLTNRQDGELDVGKLKMFKFSLEIIRMDMKK